MIKQITMYKQNGETEDFDIKKLYDSIIKSCLAVGNTEKQAELFADKVCELTEEWLQDKTEITVKDVRVHICHFLRDYNADASDYYRNFKEII